MEDWKAKLGAAFQVAVPSDEEIKQAQEQATAGVPKGDALAQQGKHMVNVLLDKKGRKGKQATLVTDLLCNDAALKALAATLKKHCGVGGSARDGEILIQGDRRQQVLDFLTGQGFKARII
ncbi:SUI1 family translation initiation factor [Sodaliphilus pleomorphus]|jgi:translation initiation factor 1|uniref:Translation initiation factor n=1 Tax=Sodaliphilus pleomorphus TaxID=2606626 RepID=A0A6L5X968_9BACT|nr:translation initiation factor [Sodaliphilus pleomorphus]MCI6169279.1 translation initiation factor [Muribaculaceae bacterium]MDY6251241.1 translation initiation factor [Bacteroidales bacterium]MDD6475846.1 translation initiation factor [Sodaliphilus pleomorphus]MDY6258258.1 translation initiation factor [Bacteroidales bacterium]MSS16919.1 translation initiation factor [Sodaliphilus pleomorphus]